MFDPMINTYPYPEVTDKHYLKVKKNHGIIFDTKYPYIDNSLNQKLSEFGVRILLYTCVFPIMRIITGLKIKGRKNLKKHRDEIKDGIISCSNHVHMWDYIAVMRAVVMHKTHILAWDKNINGENGKLIRSVGGIPVPVGNMKASAKMVKDVINLLDNGGWLHISAEGSMWEYYAPIRPFKDGPAYFAYKAGKPVLPLAFSYRKPKGINKLFHKRPLLTISIGEPLYINKELEKTDAINDLTIRVHEAVCKLAGFEDGQNIYEPIFNNSKRIDYYTTEYGVGYKREL